MRVSFDKLPTTGGSPLRYGPAHEYFSFKLWGGPFDGCEVEVPRFTRPLVKLESGMLRGRVLYVYAWVENPARGGRVEYTYRTWEGGAREQEAQQIPPEQPRRPVQ